MPITCSQCGAQNEEGNFCFQCGSRLGAAPPPQTPIPGQQAQTPHPGAPAPQPAYPQAQPIQPAYPQAQPAQPAYPQAHPPQTPFPGQPAPYQGAQPGQPFPGNQQPFPGGQHAAAQQQFPGGYPQQQFPGGYGQAPKKSGGGRVVLGLIAALVLLGGVWYAKNALFPGPDPEPTPNPVAQGGQSGQPQGGQGAQGGQSTPPAQGGQGSQSAQTGPKIQVTQVMTGNFKLGQAEIYDAFDNVLGAAKGNRAAFYEFNEDGTYTQISEVIENGMGAIKHIAVGDLLNNGEPVMMVAFEQGMWIMRFDGTSSKLDIKAEKILIGNFAGDSNRESLFITTAADGRKVLQVLDFSNQVTEVAKVTTASVPDTLINAHVRDGGIDLLSSYRREGNDLVFELYRMDLTKGLVLEYEYPVTDPAEAPAVWYGMGSVSDGIASLAVSRQGAKGSIDLHALVADGTIDLGNFKINGGTKHAVVFGTFQGYAPRIMSIDENGNYFIYKITQ